MGLTPEALGEVLWIITDRVKTVPCNDDEVNCLCKTRVYKELDYVLQHIGLSRRRVRANTLPRGCIPVIYSEEVILDGGEPVALIAVKKSYENGEVEVAMDVIEVYDDKAKEVLCRKMPRATACRKVVATV